MPKWSDHDCESADRINNTKPYLTGDIQTETRSPQVVGLRRIESPTFYLNVSSTYVLPINQFDVLAFLQSADNWLLSTRVCYDWAATGPTAWN